MTDLTKLDDQLFLPFILKNYEIDLLQILGAYNTEVHYGVEISTVLLASQDYAAAEILFSNPRGILPFLDSSLIAAQQAILDKQNSSSRHHLSIKENIHARLRGPATFLDTSSREACPQIADISAGHIDKLITITGTVVRTGTVKLLEARRLYECNKCHHRFVVAADLEMGATVQLPTFCPSNKPRPCIGTNFRHCEEVSLFTNFQEIQVQEGQQCFAVGSSSRALTLVLQDDLADTCHVGESIEASGIVVKQFGSLYPNVRCHVSLVLQATSLTVSRKQRTVVDVPPEMEDSFRAYWESQRHTPLAARNALIAGMCPQLFGLFSIKLASLLMLIGGTTARQAPPPPAAAAAVALSVGDLESGPRNAGNVRENNQPNINDAALCVSRPEDYCSTIPHPDTNTNGTRSEIHFLLVGDPGTGKSQFQRYISLLSPRAVLTSGKTSSAAGLTAAAIKDGAYWTLEAGALVLADGGICCIDEFDAVRESDRAALHEAMEQQTCSVAKAGIMTTLHTRASVFGTCNPKGHRRYNPRRPLSEQLNISGPLLSRFDIVLLLLDDMNPVWDEAVADHILEMHRRQGQVVMKIQKQGCSHRKSSISHGSESGLDGNTPDRSHASSHAIIDPGVASLEWNIETLRQYIVWVKSNFNPILTPPAENILSGYYQLRRGTTHRHAARTTIRLLESLVRLAQAHAKLMARHYVDVQDAVFVVALVDSSVVDGEAMLELPHGVGVGAPGDQFGLIPDDEYIELERAVLRAVSGLGDAGHRRGNA